MSEPVRTDPEALGPLVERHAYRILDSEHRIVGRAVRGDASATQRGVSGRGRSPYTLIR
jgi:hypothetical protein